MTKTLPVSVRLAPETKAVLESAAKADHRSMSSLIEKILTEWVDAAPKAKKAAKR